MTRLNGGKAFENNALRDIADKMSDDAPRIIEAARADEKPVDTGGAAAEAENEHEFELVLAGDIPLEMPKWLVRKWIPAESIGMIFGPSGCMKSFFALDLAACVASGRTFHNHSIRTPGAVVYLASEGFSGLRRRLRAWELLRGGDDIDFDKIKLRLSRRAPTLTTMEAASDVLRAIAKAKSTDGDISLVVVDTLARATTGADENSNRDMGQFVQIMEHIQKTYACTVVVVHHTGLSDESRGRGAGCVRAALDFEIKMKKNADCTEIEFTKVKEGQQGEIAVFQWDAVEVGRDEDDEIVDSIVLRLADDDTTRKKTEKPLSEHAHFALRCFREAAETVGELAADGSFNGVQLSKWKQVFFDKSSDDNEKSLQTRFDRAKKELVSESRPAAAKVRFEKRGKVKVFFPAGDLAALDEKNFAEKLKKCKE